MIDLHTHTTASDGTLPPADLVAYAKKQGLEAIAVTDHDTIAGVAEALASRAAEAMEVVPGIEISAEFPGGTMHILGYYFNTADERFSAKIAELQKARADRNPKIIAKLQALGMRIAMDDVAAEAGGGQVGRPHFAQALLKKGYVKTTKEAFDRLLAKGCPAYCEKFRFPPEEAIACISDAGGIPVLAHPSSLNCSDARALEKVVEAMVGQGIRGIEAYYSDHSSEQTRQYIALARKHNLLVTGGSDFHGATIKGVSLGSGRGNLNIPYACLAAMREAIGRHA